MILLENEEITFFFVNDNTILVCEGGHIVLERFNIVQIQILLGNMLQNCWGKNKKFLLVKL